MRPFVSFVIPSIGRESLLETLHSLKTQTDPDFNAVVVANGYQQDVNQLPDKRFGVAHADQPFESAGEARNVGVMVTDGEWMAFVNDDDIVTPHYVELLKDHASEMPEADIIVFRMNHPKLGITPSPSDPRLDSAQLVGPSFAIKTRWFRATAIEFGPDGYAGIMRDLTAHGARLFLSPYLTYVARPHVSPRAVEGRRG